MEYAGTGNTATGRSAVRKASWRILPLLGLGYLVACMDRANISFAATQMNHDLHFTATVYGLGGGMFFVSYALFEIPSNLLLIRYGARRWIARIMVTWGLLAMAMMLVRTPWQFYAVRFLLGFAEAGFFPGVVYYMTHWFPMAERGRAVSRMYVAGPASGIVMGLVSGWLLRLDGLATLRGWQWLFLLEGLPAVIVGLAIFRLLPNAPATAAWLAPEEKAWLTRELAADAIKIGQPVSHGVLGALRNPMVLQLGVIGALSIGCFYALNLSAPALLMAGTGLAMTKVGYLTSLGNVLGAAGMLYTGPLTDRLGSRIGVLLSAMMLMALGCAILALATSPQSVVAGYLVFMLAWSTVTNSTVLLWADVLPLGQLAVGAAAINSMSMVGGFTGPYLWGVAKDATRSYSLALTVMAGAMLLAAGLVMMLGAGLARRRAAVLVAIS